MSAPSLRIGTFSATVDAGPDARPDDAEQLRRQVARAQHRVGAELLDRVWAQVDVPEGHWLLRP